jgi:hypothetical protein
MLKCSSPNKIQQFAGIKNSANPTLSGAIATIGSSAQSYTLNHPFGLQHLHNEFLIVEKKLKKNYLTFVQSL